MEKTINERRLEYLQDDINYYWGKPERRCVDENGKCQYMPSETSEGCSIGRRLPLEIRQQLLQSASVISYAVFPKLPEEMKSLEVAFLDKAQELHDKKDYAKKNKNAIQGVCEFFNLDFNQLTFPE